MRSKFEKEVMKHNKGLKYEPIKLTYSMQYTPDFKLKNGILIECKGWTKTLSADLAKLKKVRESNPEVDLRLLWQKLSMKVSKSMTAAEWSEKYGFKYAEGPLVPRDWMI